MVYYPPMRRLSMSLKALPIPPVPEETARVAHAVFPRGNVFMQVRDTLGAIYTDEAFADLFPTHGQPAEAPWRLALVTIFQFMEHLTDRQAADAVRSRLDWKYALSLELTDPGFDHTVLSEFRSRLVEGNGERLEHERLPKEEHERKHYANQVGADGWTLLHALDAPSTADWLKTLPAVMTLRTIWEQQFEPLDQGGQWRLEPALPAAQ